MRRLSILTLLLLLAFPALAQSRKAPAKKPSASAPKKSSTTRKRPAPAKKSTTSQRKSAGSKKQATRTRSTRPAKKSTRSRSPSWRAGQQVPTPQRYAEIQQALIERGYLTGPSTGAWGTESAEALRKFQEDQNLEPTGKLDALSLIALGLGPSRDTTIPRPHASGGAKPEPKQPQ